MAGKTDFPISSISLRGTLSLLAGITEGGGKKTVKGMSSVEAFCSRSQNNSIKGRSLAWEKNGIRYKGTEPWKI